MTTRSVVDKILLLFFSFPYIQEEKQTYKIMIEINKLISEAMKSRNLVELKAYKNIKAEIQILKTAKNAKPYDEAAELGMINKMCKRLSDGIEEFKAAGREDLVKEYQDELGVLKTLLPPAISEEDIENTIKEWMDINDLSNSIPKKSMGMVIKYVKMKLPTADGKTVSGMVSKMIEK